MNFAFADRMGRLGTESAFEVLAAAKRLEATGKSMIHLEIGEPDFATPSNIVEAATTAMREGMTHYTPASGILQVREATAAFVAARTGVSVEAANVVLVPGSKNILMFALMALVNEGDEVIVPDPGYPIYASLANFLGAKVVPVPIRESNDFRVDVEELARLVTPKTKLLIVNSPQNPTGGVLEQSDCLAIAELSRRHNLVVLSDEIYSQLVYEGSCPSLYGTEDMHERTILMDGLSKAWAMCGWRLGYGVMPVELAKRMDTLMINSSSCAAAFTQMAAVEAFTSPESAESVAVMKAEFHRRRDILVDGLNGIPGVTCHRPKGAFYVFPNIAETGRDERALAADLMNEAGVAVLAGSAFGACGRGYLRLSYANSVANLEEAVSRISRFLSRAPVAG